MGDKIFFNECQTDINTLSLLVYLERLNKITSSETFRNLKCFF